MGEDAQDLGKHGLRKEYGRNPCLIHVWDFKTELEHFPTQISAICARE